MQHFDYACDARSRQVGNRRRNQAPRIRPPGQEGTRWTLVEEPECLIRRLSTETRENPGVRAGTRVETGNATPTED